MPDRTYTTKYVVDNSQAIAAIDQLIAKLTALDVLATALTPKLRNIASGMPGSLNKASAAAAPLTVNLTNIHNAAQQAAGSLNAASAAARAAGRSARATGAAAQGMNNEFLAIRAGGLVLNEVKDIIGGLAKGLEAARKYAEETARENIRLKDSLRELGALNRSKDVDQVHGDVLDLMLKTGATKDEANDFSTLFDSTVPAARDKVDEKGEKTWGLNEQQEQELKGKLLALAVAKGVKPGVFAEVMGGLGINQPVKSVDDAMGQAGMMIDMAGDKGVGRISDVFKTARKLAPSLVRPDGTGAAKSEAELMGLIAASTTDNGSPALSGQAISQVWRESEKPAGEKIGIKPGDDYSARLRKFKAAIDKGKADGRSEMQSLMDAGFKAPSANMAILREIKTVDLHEKWAAEAAKGGDPRAVDAQIEAFRQQQPGRFTANQEFVADRLKGREQERLVEAMQSARASLKHRGEAVDGGRTAGQFARDAFGVFDWMGGPNADVRDQHAEIRKKLLATDPRLAKQFPELAPGANSGAAVGPERLAEILNTIPKETFDRAFGKVAPQIQAGVDAMRQGAPPRNTLPAGRGAPAAPKPLGPGGPAQGAAAPGGGVGPQASADGEKLGPLLKELIGETRTQTAELRRLGGDGFGPPPFAPSAAPGRA